MRVLLLAQANSSWTMNLIQYFLLPRKVKVFLFPFYGDIEDFFGDFYQRNNVTVLKRDSKRRNGSNMPFSWLYYLKKYIRKYNIDVINLQYVELIYAVPIVLLKKSGQRVVLSYWGSDLLRKSRKQLKLMSLFLKRVDSITFDSCNLEQAFKELYGYKYNNIVHICRFGIPVLNEIIISEQKISKEQLRQKYNISAKKVVAIGYNALKEQQHMRVIEQIAHMPQEIKEQMCLMLQMNYNISSDEYVKQVEKAAKETGCEVFVIHSYMDYAQIAEIRRITDIFINSQTTDAFAGSVAEVLYAGGILVHGEWLNYTEFEEHDVDYVPYWEFSELKTLLPKVIEGSCVIDKTKNRSIMNEMRGWDYCGIEWGKWMLGETN